TRGAPSDYSGESERTRMKIAILCHKDVADWYAATLMQRGHKVTISGGGAIHAPGLKPYLECDGCLLLGDDPDLLEIADYMEASGKTRCCGSKPNPNSIRTSLRDDSVLDPAAGGFPIGVAQFALHDLAGILARQPGLEADHARHLVVGEPLGKEGSHPRFVESGARL